MRLAQIGFTDIYIAEHGAGLARGMPGKPGLAPVPEQCHEDVLALLALVRERHAETGHEFQVVFDGVSYRGAEIPAQEGLWFALRRATHAPHLDDLGLPDRIVDELAALGKSQGMVLISGATGQGKTTSASAMMLEWLNRWGDVGVTIEDPPELPLEGAHREGYCYQVEVEGGDFATPLVRAMRWRPRYILLGEVRTGAAAEQAVRAAINGHLIVTTIHAGSVEESLMSLLRLGARGGDDDVIRAILADGLACAMHQTLVGDPPRPALRTLFTNPRGACPVRAKLRDGKIGQLNTNIKQQFDRMAAGKPMHEVVAG